MAYALLGLAIAAEICATSLLKSTDGFTVVLPTMACLAGYLLSFVLLAVAVRDLPVGFCYAVWSGVGTAAIVTIGAVFLGEDLSLVSIGGVVLVIAGVVALNLGSVH
jgi:small multidrug resistance pump